MSISGAVNVLRRTAAFGGLGDDRLNVLAFSGERVKFSTGELIVDASEPPARCVVVLDGRVEIGSGDDGRPACVVSSGATIGETALITNLPFAHTVRGDRSGEVLVITRPLFERIIEDFPDIAAHLRDQMRDRLGDTLRQLSALERRLRYPNQADGDQNAPAPARGRTVSPSPAPRRSR